MVNALEDYAPAIVLQWAEVSLHIEENALVYTHTSCASVKRFQGSLEEQFEAFFAECQLNNTHIRACRMQS